MSYYHYSVTNYGDYLLLLEGTWFVLCVIISALQLLNLNFLQESLCKM